MSRRPEFLLALCLAAAPALAASETADPAAEVIVRARTATIQQQQGLAEYVGDAEMVQGERLLQGDRIVIELRDNQPQRIEATGDPVILTEGDTMEARAQRVVYDMDAGRIWLYENARVENEGRLFEGAELEYVLETQQVKARSSGEDDRVKLVIPAEDEGKGENRQ